MPKPIIIVRLLTNDGDTWIALNNGRQSRWIGFLYSDEPPSRLVEVVAAVVKLAGGTVESLAPAAVAFEAVEGKAGWTITSPLTGRKYAAESEGAALASLLRKEPAALMAF